MDFRRVLRRTKYRDKINCLIKMFENAGIVDDETLQQAPILLGHVCGCDIYDLVRTINEAIAEVELKVEETIPTVTVEVPAEETEAEIEKEIKPPVKSRVVSRRK